MHVIGILKARLFFTWNKCILFGDWVLNFHLLVFFLHVPPDHYTDTEFPVKYNVSLQINIPVCSKGDGWYIKLAVSHLLSHTSSYTVQDEVTAFLV